MALNNTYTLLAYKEMATSSSCFEFRWEVRLADPTKPSTTYYIYTYLRWVAGTGGTASLVKKGSCPAPANCKNKNPTTYLDGVETLTRMQHKWKIVYTIDGKQEVKKFDTAATCLPDDNAKKGVVSTGHLHMKKNEWYQWGPAKTGTWNNDGSKHTVKVTMHDTQGFNNPKNCPSADAPATTAEKTFAMPQYAITPGKATAIVSGAWYEHSVTWAAVTNAKDYKLQWQVNGGAWEDVTSWSTSKSYAPRDLSAFDPGTTISYRVIARSSTNHTSTGAATPAFSIGGGVKIKVNGVWKPGIVYVKVNGVWRKADYVAIKQNNSWKISAY